MASLRLGSSSRVSLAEVAAIDATLAQAAHRLAQLALLKGRMEEERRRRGRAAAFSGPGRRITVPGV